jgi:hypothetical protein
LTAVKEPPRTKKAIPSFLAKTKSGVSGWSTTRPTTSTGDKAAPVALPELKPSTTSTSPRSPAVRAAGSRQGFPTFDVLADAPPVTGEMVREALDEDDAAPAGIAAAGTPGGERRRRDRRLT